MPNTHRRWWWICLLGLGAIAVVLIVLVACVVDFIGYTTPTATYAGPRPPIDAIALSANERLLAMATGADDARVWDVDGCRELVAIPNRCSAVRRVAFWPDGSRLLVSTTDSDVEFSSTTVWDISAVNAKVLSGASVPAKPEVWEPPYTTPLFKLTTKGRVWSSFFSPDGTRLIIGSGRSIYVYDVAGDQVVEHAVFEAHRVEIRDVAISPDGRMLASCGAEKRLPEDVQTIKLWETSSGRLLGERGVGVRYVCALALDPERNTLLAASDLHGPGAVLAWALDDLARPTRKMPTREGVTSLAVSGDGRRVAAGTKGGEIYIWDYDTSQLLQRIRVHSAVLSVAFVPGKKSLLAGLRSGEVNMYKIDW